jgi:hypothetical protein
VSVKTQHSKKGGLPSFKKQKGKKQPKKREEGKTFVIEYKIYISVIALYYLYHSKSQNISNVIIQICFKTWRWFSVTG